MLILDQQSGINRVRKLRNNHPIVIIGGNDAGLAAAGRIKRIKPETAVFVYEKTCNLAYASCGLPYYISNKVAAESVRGIDSERMLQKRGIKAFTEFEVVEIDVKHRCLHVHDKKLNSHQSVFYKKLIIATGAKPVIPKEIAGYSNVFAVRSFSDAEAVHSFLNDSSQKSALVIGAGFLGLEISEALLKRGCKVILIDSALHLANLPESFSERLVQRLASAGIILHLGTTVKEWQTSGTFIKGYKLTSSFAQVDFVFSSCGIQPNNFLAKKAGLRLGAHDAIKVNRYQQTSNQDIFAAGDCCDAIHLVTGQSAWLPFAGSAARQGKVAGENAAGGSVQFPGCLGTRITRIFGLEFGITGLTLHEARAAGFAARETIIQQPSQSQYMPGSHMIDLQVIWDRHSNRILGGAILGESGAGLRLNQLALALQAKLTIKDLLHLDLGYTPAINHMMDPLHIIGAVALKDKKEKK